MSERNEMSDSSSSLGEHNQLFKNPESKLNQFDHHAEDESGSKPEPYGDEEMEVGGDQDDSIHKPEEVA
jgi:hypothetical protein